MLQSVFAFCNAERLSAFMVYVVGALVGVYAAEGMSALQWAGAAMAVIASILVAVMVRTWPAAPKAGKARERAPE